MIEKKIFEGNFILDYSPICQISKAKDLKYNQGDNNYLLLILLTNNGFVKLHFSRRWYMLSIKTDLF